MAESQMIRVVHVAGRLVVLGGEKRAQDPDTLPLPPDHALYQDMKKAAAHMLALAVS